MGILQRPLVCSASYCSITNDCVFYTYWASIIKIFNSFSGRPELSFGPKASGVASVRNTVLLGSLQLTKLKLAVLVHKGRDLHSLVVQYVVLNSCYAANYD